jgi:hypothetical protein
MSPVMSLVLAGVAIVGVVGAISVWLAIKRPAQSLQRRQRDAALAAAEHYTPAPRQSPYGTVRPDPCAPGLSDRERVAAMRALLLRGDAQAADVPDDSFPPTQPGGDDEQQTTTPMAWKSTLPPDAADAWESHRPRARSTSRSLQDEVEHISVP